MNTNATTPSFNLPISLLRQHLFCPRIPFFILLRPLTIESPPWVKTGVEVHRDAAKRFQRRKLSRFDLQNAEWCFDLPVASSVLGLVGKLDAALVWNGLYHPVEWKTNIGAPRHAHHIQLTAYGICLKEMNRLGTPGFLCSLATLKIEPLSWLEDNLLAVHRITKEIRYHIARGIIPDSPASPEKCAQCEYLRICNDREV